MKTLFPIIIIFISYIYNTNLIFAQQDFYQLYKSAYYIGRGNTGIADSYDNEAVIYNPAGLAHGEHIYKKTILLSPAIEVSNTTKNIIKQFALDKQNDVETVRKYLGTNQHLGFYNLTGIAFKKAALATTSSIQTDLSVTKSPEFGGLETASANMVVNQALLLSLADHIIKDTLMLGGTIKYIYRGAGNITVNVADTENIKNIKDDDVMGYGNGWGFDLGLLYKIGKNDVLSTESNIGLTIENIGNTKLNIQGGSSKYTKLKQSVNLGYCFKVYSIYSILKILADYRDIFNSIEHNKFKKLYLGTEVTVKNLIGIVAGISEGYPSLGFYLDLRLIRLDVGMYTKEISDTVGLREDKRYYFRLMAGF